MKQIFVFLLVALMLSCSNEMQFELERGEKGEQGEQGEPGKDGKSVSIYALEVLPNGNVLVIFTDGDTYWNLTVPKGDKGNPGEKGNDGEPGTTGLSVYELWLFKNGEEDSEDNWNRFWEEIRGPQGIQGEQGEQGIPGVAGLGADFDFDYEYDEDDNLVLIINNKRITVPQGKQGDPGENGINGEPGEPGKDGKDGEDGKDGISLTVICLKKVEGGTYFKFSDGTEFTIKDGINGTDGTNGETLFLFIMENMIKAYYQWVSDLPNPYKSEGVTTSWPAGKDAFDKFLEYCKDVSDYYLTLTFDE